jgi:hypothetical protein
MRLPICGIERYNSSNRQSYQTKIRKLSFMNAELIEKRDTKTKPHLKQFAPVWLMDDRFVEEDNSIHFKVVFRHNNYGWVSRHYRYDSFNDVLYHEGQNAVDENDTLEIQSEVPYINTTVADIPNAYGG